MKLNSNNFIELGNPSKVKDFVGPKGIAFQEIKPRRPEGRPTIMTVDVLNKLEEAFLHGLSDEKACIYANISTQTLYNYQKIHPEFVGRKQELKTRPDITAQFVLVDNIASNLDQARWWANHKMDEFAPKSKVEVSADITGHTTMTPEVTKVIEEMNQKMREAIAAPHKQI